MQEQTGKPLGRILGDLNFLRSEELIAFVGRQLEIPHVDLSSYIIESEVIDLIPEATARKYKLIPLFRVEDRITVAMADPVDIFALDDIKLQVGCDVNPTIASEESIIKAIDEYYGGTRLVEEAVESISRSTLGLVPAEKLAAEKLERVIEQPPIVKLVNQIFLEAIRSRASDIHLEVQKEGTDIRYRIDGILHRVSSIPKHLTLPVISRIKIMSGLDITERRIPQDGHIRRKLGEKEIDLRISTSPTIYGEKVALRILDKSAMAFSLADIGLSPSSLRQLRELIRRRSGLIIISGPTGCGKTSTLYAILNAINSPEKNIMTLEDPVEYEVQHVNQEQINPKAGFTFPMGLKSILRQDPDIIMVGEIRDFETAELVIRASITGHLVFSTLHTMDAAGILTRLIDIGVEPFLIASTVIGLVAQRLVRKICTKCREEYTPSLSLLEQVGWSGKKDLKLHKGRGCKECKHTGYKGRTGLFELVVVNEKIRGLIMGKTPSTAIAEAARKSGMKSLREDGLDKILAGITTIEEVLRETQSDE